MPNWLKTTFQIISAIVVSILAYIVAYVVCEIIFAFFASIFGVGLAALLTLCVAMSMVVIVKRFIDKEMLKDESHFMTSLIREEFIQGLRHQKRQMMKMAFEQFIRSNGLLCPN